MPGADPRGYYRALEVGRDAGEEEIRANYKRLALQFHPDKSGGGDSKERFQAVLEAYSVLKDTEKRKRYDLCLDPDELDEDFFEDVDTLLAELDLTFRCKKSRRARKGNNARVEVNVARLIQQFEAFEREQMAGERKPPKAKTKAASEEDEWESVEED